MLCLPLDRSAYGAPLRRSSSGGTLVGLSASGKAEPPADLMIMA